MVFSSVTFLFYFLPIFFVAYFAVRGVQARNMVLLLFSLVFYTWGETQYSFIMLGSIGANYLIALVIDRQIGYGRAMAVAAGVTLNLLLLAVFKYSDFVVSNLSPLLSTFGVSISNPGIRLPLGISFFTFHSISYLVDVATRRVKANNRIDEVALYISMFPQLVAGPIVRYSTVASQIRSRRTTVGRISAGLRIFVIGLSWKVLIADQVAPIAAAVFDGTTTPSLLDAWVGLVAYAIQIYFDFGGYSNMAIGLGVALGFPFPRNFRVPYAAQSITEFWRRWHMSLSSWFRDYLYIPLGGSRRGPYRTYFNLGLVFLLCGLWHGASWTFVIWGLHHGTFLILERAGLQIVLDKSWRIVRHAYTLLIVLSGWVWFRSHDVDGSLELFGALFGVSGIGQMSVETHMAMTPLSLIALTIGAFLSLTGTTGFAFKRKRTADSLLDSVLVTSLLVLSAVSIGAGTYSPFLYFRF
jgi:alginate O-acetyltransferase complex protein AlgI